MALALAATPISAFPHLMSGAFQEELAKRQIAAPQGVGALPLTPPPFNATAQYVSTKGKYAASQ